MQARPDGRNIMKAFVFPLMATLLSLLVVGLVLEAGLRLAGYSPGNVNPLKAFHEYDPLTGHIGKKNYSGRFRRPEFDATVVHDSRGFRKQEYLARKQDDLPAIHVFGDSFTWGWGVSQGEVFTDQLNRLLPGYRVINYGINGVGTLVEHLLFSATVKPNLKPGDIVLVMVFNNDFTDNLNTRGVHAEVAGERVTLVNSAGRFESPVQDFLASRSYLYNYLAYKVNLYQLSRKRKKDSDETAGQPIAASDPRYVVMKHYIGLFRQECGEKGAAFIAAYIPGQSELGEASQLKPNKLANEKNYHDAFMAVCASVRCEPLDLLPYFEVYRKDHNKRLTFPGDEHWNLAGHAAAASVIRDFLSKHNYLTRSGYEHRN
jgi:lysophospholipase L1-like esterase